MTETLASAAEAPTRPRIRWAGVIWGALFAGAAGWALWILMSMPRRLAAADWISALTPTTITLYALLAVGALLLVAGAVGVIRRAERRLAARREGDA